MTRRLFLFLAPILAWFRGPKPALVPMPLGGPYRGAYLYKGGVMLVAVGPIIVSRGPVGNMMTRGFEVRPVPSAGDEGLG
jgi:hypothetical protein